MTVSILFSARSEMTMQIHWFWLIGGLLPYYSKLPRDVQRVKLKQKEEQQNSSGAGMVKKLRKVLIIDMRRYSKSDRIKLSRRRERMQQVIRQ
jgi:hypothetical protein